MPKAKIKLCTPRDAKPIRRKVAIAGWTEMEFDAAVFRHGVRWLHVKDGMGGYGDREDWVCDLPGVTLSIHDYNWDGQNFGANLGKTFDEAVVAAMEQEHGYQEHQISELRAECATKEKGLLALEAAIKKATTMRAGKK